MAREDKKKVLLGSFPAVLVLLRGKDGRAYVNVQPEFDGKVLSHSRQPQGGAHVRLSINGREIDEFNVGEESVRYLTLSGGVPSRVAPPETAATASFAPVDYDSFKTLRVTKDASTSELLVSSSTDMTVSVVFYSMESDCYRPIPKQ